MHQPASNDKHGLLTAPISDVLRQMTIPMIFGLVAILMFNLVDTFFYLTTWYSISCRH